MARIETPGPFKTGTGAANAMTTAASLTTERLKQQEQMQELGMYSLKKQALQVESAVSLATAKTRMAEANAKAAKARQEELLTKGTIEATRALGGADYELPLNPSPGTHGLYDSLQNLDRQIKEGRAAGQDVTHYEIARGQLRAQFDKSAAADNRTTRFVSMAARAEELRAASGVAIPDDLQAMFDAGEMGANGYPGANSDDKTVAAFKKYERQATAVAETLAERRRVVMARTVLQERLDATVDSLDGAEAGGGDKPKATSSPLYQRAQKALTELNGMDPDKKPEDMWGVIAQARTDIKKLGDPDLRADGEKMIRFMDEVDLRMAELREMEEVSRASDELEKMGSRSPLAGMADAHQITIGGNMMSPYFRESLTTEQAANDAAIMERVKERRGQLARERGKDVSLTEAIQVMDAEWQQGQTLQYGAEQVLGLQPGDEDLMVDGTGDPMIIRNGESYTQSEAITDDAYGWVLKGGDPAKYPNNSRAQSLMSIKPKADGTIEVTDQNRKALNVLARYGFVVREEEVGDDAFTISPQGKAMGLDNPRRMLSTPAGQEVFRRMYRDMGTSTGHKYRDEALGRLRLTEEQKAWWPSGYFKRRAAEKRESEALKAAETERRGMQDPLPQDVQSMADGPYADPQAFDALMSSFEGPNWDMGQPYTPTSMEMAEFWQFQAEAEQKFGPAPAEGMPAIPPERYDEIAREMERNGWTETRVGKMHTGWTRSRGSFKERERMSWSSPQIRERLGLPAGGFGRSDDAAGRKQVREAHYGKPLTANLDKAQYEELGQKLREEGAKVTFASRRSGRITKVVMKDGTVYDLSDPDTRLRLAQKYLQDADQPKGEPGSPFPGAFPEPMDR